MLDELSSLFLSSSLPLWLGRGAEDEDEPEDDAACCCSSHQSQSQPDRAETAKMAARARDRIRFAFITVLLLEKPGPEKYTFPDWLFCFGQSRRAGAGFVKFALKHPLSSCIGRAFCCTIIVADVKSHSCVKKLKVLKERAGGSRG